VTGTRTNNFDALRLIAAAMVVFGHSFILSGFDPFVLLGKSVSTLAVLVFFSISGYLVANSWMKDPSPWRFVLRRARRIHPALVVVVCACVLILGPLVTTLPLATYARHPLTRRYFGNLIFYSSFVLPGVFTGNRYPNTVNGSLWTLPVEATMYALTPLLALPGRWRSVTIGMLGIAITLGVYAIVASPAQVLVGGTDFWSATMLAPYFVSGSAMACFRLEHYFRVRVGIALLLILQFAPLGAGTREVLLCLILPYTVLSIGLRSSPLLRSAGRFGDASYGIYLWSFPVQQLTVHLIGTAGGGWTNFAIAMPVSLALGFASWHLLEKRVLGRTRRPASDQAAEVFAARPRTA
jgi:peptidoglycan/LPS O-acetylase OafA/YrhL